jgi:hypothetical protein
MSYVYVYACMLFHMHLYVYVSSYICLYATVSVCICIYVPEARVPRRSRQEHRWAVWRPGRRAAATGTPPGLATWDRLDYPRSLPGCLMSLTHTPVSGPAGPSPPPAGPAQSCRTQEACVDRYRTRTRQSRPWQVVYHGAGEERFPIRTV